MISNERQYRITKAEAERFKHALADFEARGNLREGIHPRLIQAEHDALQSQLDDLSREIIEYEALKAGNIPVIEINSFEELADGLIKARIGLVLARKLSRIGYI